MNTSSNNLFIKSSNNKKCVIHRNTNLFNESLKNSKKVNETIPCIDSKLSRGDYFWNVIVSILTLKAVSTNSNCNENCEQNFHHLNSSLLIEISIKYNITVREVENIWKSYYNKHILKNKSHAPLPSFDDTSAKIGKC